MKPLRFCLDTSTFGGLTDDEPPGWREATIAFFERSAKNGAKLYYSTVLIGEIEKAPRRVSSVAYDYINRYSATFVPESSHSIFLANLLIARGILSKKSVDDARHLGVAIALDMDALVAWDFNDLVNFRVRKGARSICVEFGHTIIDLVSPMEVFTDE